MGSVRGRLIAVTSVTAAAPWASQVPAARAEFAERNEQVGGEGSSPGDRGAGAGGRLALPPGTATVWGRRRLPAWGPAGRLAVLLAQSSCRETDSSSQRRADWCRGSTAARIQGWLGPSGGTFPPKHTGSEPLPPAHDGMAVDPRNSRLALTQAKPRPQPVDFRGRWCVGWGLRNRLGPGPP